MLNDDKHVEVEVAWLFLQRIVAPTATPTGPAPRPALDVLIGELRDGVPAALTELIRLGRTLNRRAVDVLAYFDRPGTSNGPPRPTASSNTSAAPPWVSRYLTN